MEWEDGKVCVNHWCRLVADIKLIMDHMHMYTKSLIIHK